MHKRLNKVWNYNDGSKWHNNDNVTGHVNAMGPIIGLDVNELSRNSNYGKSVDSGKDVFKQ